jgi:type IV secretory pathway VirB6-like protein
MKSEGYRIIRNRITFLASLLLVAFISFTIFSVDNAYAVKTPKGGVDANCTANPDGSDTPRFEIDPLKITDPVTLLQDGLITSVVNKIKDKLMGTTIKVAGVEGTTGVAPSLFKSITHDSGFLGTLRAAMTLYIAIYGILFMAGIAEIKFHDLIVMFAKFGVVGVLLSDSSWDFFNHTVVRFFNDGTDDLINKITAIAVGNATPVIGSAGAFGAIDSAISKAVSSKMLVTLMAALPANLYGLLFAALLGFSLFLFLKSMITATWVYVMSMAMKTLLFGLAPIFIPCILFKRTEHLFHGWLGQVVGASIQPVLLFVFLSFFVNLMDASMINIMHTPVCWSKVPEGLRGSPFQIFFWRFMQRDSSGHWVPREGVLDNNSFPMDLVAILTFFILAYLANSFNMVVIQISQSLSSAAGSLHDGNPVHALGEKIGGLISGKK